ncbi:MAG: translation initiation factor IF-2 [Planctomycetota bacterium]
MSKVRVYELAKEYGVKGPDLAKLLKESGFEKVKSHMAVLDDATELHARAVIEAQGLQRSASGGDAADDGAPKKKTLKKKALPKKSLSGGSAAVEETAEAPAADADAPDALPKKKALPKKSLPSAGESAEPEAPAKKSLPKKALPTTGQPVAEKPAAPAKNTLPSENLPTNDSPATETAPESAAPAQAKPKAPSEETPPKTPAPISTAAEATAEAPAAPRAPQPEAAQQASSEAPAPTKAPAPAEAAAPTDAQPKVPSKASTETPAEATAPAAESTTPAPEASAVDAAPPAADDADAGKTPAQRLAERPAPEAKEAAAASAEGEDVKKLRVPEQKAKKVGFIELPQEAIRDAKQRSAPNAGRNPGSVDRGLRQRALRNTASRTAGRRGGPGGPGGRRGPGFGRGPQRGGPRQNRRSSNKSGLSSTVDPNKEIEIMPPISVKALSEALGVKVGELITALTFKLGVLGKNINSFLSPEEVELVALEVKRNVKIVEETQAEAELLQTIVDAAEDHEDVQRAPVVTFMGHVDHGKTSLLDALRDSDVTKGEAGGITQHVGAYKIVRPDGSGLVILDTPGHEAFTQMRVRGANLTDVVVLVVAADDGVMPQTEEAIAHAKEAGTPIVVAINKCDRPDSNPNTVRQQLAVKGLQAEGDWGGEIGMIEVSAHTGQGLNELVERIFLEAEILELGAKSDAAGEAVVIESKQTPEQGVTVNVLVTNGTLRLRDQVLCGESLSRVRGLIDDHGRRLDEAGPSTPVSLVGITSLPLPGDKLYVVNDTKKAKEVVEERQTVARKKSLAERSTLVQMDAMDRLAAAQAEEVKIILKADVMGSLEPIRTSLARLNTDEVKVRVIHSALGGITETDISLAEASGAIVVGFNAVADSSARQAADRAGVDIRFYSIIYELIDEMKLAMEGKLKPDEIEESIGHAEIKAVFRSSKFGNIAGCMVQDGIIRRNARCRLSRDGAVIYQGTIASLRREKDDAKEVRGGFECGLTLKDYNDIKEGDILECFDVKLVKRTLD